ncbi:xanthine dehydrogenase family protein molybdopterin-binding subunit, partial [Nonomuraea lactucae]|uniref:xanthine dehydrogenase family protein molybdopterin-binding subunit n=1 Tax=Nonomuraea lactucae TaxID=2249762 RepID=UPI0013B3BCBE
AAAHRARLALDADGRFVALHADVVGDLGAHPSNVGASPFAVTATTLPGPYRFDRTGVRLRGVVTTTTPTGSYRGFGQPEATYTRERLIDEAARRLGLDPVELRLGNMIGPDELPCATRTWQTYDSGDYPRALRTLRDLVTPPARDDGRRRGVGFSCHVEATGLGPSMDMKAMGMQAGGFETAVLRMEPDASVVVASGVTGIGQGIETALAQLAADRVGVPLDRVRVVLGDTAATPYSSIGSIASRSLALGGGALVQAADRLREKILAIAAHRLEAAPDDLEITGSAVQVKGDPRASLTLREIATSAWRAWDLPEGATPGLEERVSYDPPASTYAYGAHAAAVAVDPETGAVEVEGYWVVNDAGVLVNPAIVEGQIRGGVAQGIGMALTEEIVYTGDGQPIIDYLLPTTREIPDIQVLCLETSSPITPGGMKGVGEAGTIGPPAAIGNAVAAALPEVAGDVTATPLTPEGLWTLLRNAGDRPG